MTRGPPISMETGQGEEKCNKKNEIDEKVGRDWAPAKTLQAPGDGPDREPFSLGWERRYFRD